MAREQRSTRRTTPGPQDSVTPPDIPAPSYQSQGADFPHFVWQQLGDLQARLGEINTKLDANSESIKGVKSKVDDLVAWKHMILGGATVLGAAIALIAWVGAKASNYLEIKAPPAAAPISIQQSPAPAPAQVPQAPAK